MTSSYKRICQYLDLQSSCDITVNTGTARYHGPNDDLAGSNAANITDGDICHNTKARHVA
jgi:hypothetical protein